MGTKEALKQKVEADLELAHAKLAELKARAKSSAADARVKYAVHIEELEQKMKATKIKLQELGEASEESWERLKDGVENSWKALSLAVRDAVAKFKH